MTTNLPNFEDLLKLAKDDPDQLEALRQSLVQELIDETQGDQKRRLEGLQFRIDMERRRSKNPIQSCVKLSKMMHDSVQRLSSHLSEIKTGQMAVTEPLHTQESVADVISFESKRPVELEKCE